MVFFSMVSEVNDNGTSSSKKLCQNVSCPYEKNKCVLHHFNICDTSGDNTTDIDPFLLGKKCDIFISGTFEEETEEDSQMYYVMFIIMP